jgi:hypothetical protein
MRAPKKRTLTKVPTVKEYAALTAKERLEAANLRTARMIAYRAETRVLEARARYALIERNAYAYKQWAELRWPEPYSLGQKRLQAIQEEMDALK